MKTPRQQIEARIAELTTQANITESPFLVAAQLSEICGLRFALSVLPTDAPEPTYIPRIGDCYERKIDSAIVRITGIEGVTVLYDFLTGAGTHGGHPLNSWNTFFTLNESPLWR